MDLLQVRAIGAVGRPAAEHQRPSLRAVPPEPGPAEPAGPAQGFGLVHRPDGPGIPAQELRDPAIRRTRHPRPPRPRRPGPGATGGPAGTAADLGLHGLLAGPIRRDIREVDRLAEDDPRPRRRRQRLEDLVGRRRADDVGRHDRHAGADRDVGGARPDRAKPTARGRARSSLPGRSAGRGPRQPQRRPDRGQVAAVAIDRDAADVRADPVQPRRIVVLAGDHESQQPAARAWSSMWSIPQVWFAIRIAGPDSGSGAYPSVAEPMPERRNRPGRRRARTQRTRGSRAWRSIRRPRDESARKSRDRQEQDRQQQQEPGTHGAGGPGLRKEKDRLSPGPRRATGSRPFSSGRIATVGWP